MKYIFITLIPLLTVFSCFGQDTIRKNSLALNFGPGYMMRQDLVFSPFIHSDFTFLNFGITYTRQAKLFQKASLRYGNFNPMIAEPYDFTINDEVITANPHSFNFIDIDYLIGKTIQQTEEASVTFGGLLSADVQAMNYVYGRISNLGYYSAIGAGAFAKYELAFDTKSRLSATLQFPIIAWLARSPYLVNDDEFIENISSHSDFKSFTAFIGDGDLVTWNKLQTFDFDVTYTYRLNEKWAFGAAYLLEFIHVGQPRNLLSFRNSINFSSTFSF